MKKGLRLRKLALGMTVLIVLTAFCLSGCGSQPNDEKAGSADASSDNKTLNDEVLLKTEQVEQLLKDNGVKLVRDDSFHYIWLIMIINKSDHTLKIHLERFN